MLCNLVRVHLTKNFQVHQRLISSLQTVWDFCVRVHFSQCKPVPNEYFDLLIAISIENGRLGKNQGGYFSQWNICENIGKCEKRKLLESSHASTIMMTARGFEEAPSINQGRWVFITIMMLLVISDQEFDDQHHQHDDQHQVEELHCRHHPHKGHRSLSPTCQNHQRLPWWAGGGAGGQTASLRSMFCSEQKSLVMGMQLKYLQISQSWMGVT